MMPLWIWSAVIAAALAITALVVLAALAARMRRRLARQERLTTALERDIQALCDGARGMGDAIARLEARTRTLGERQEEAVQGVADLSAYRRAIGLVRKGAGVHDLVEHLGLEPGEAELVYRLHHHARPEPVVTAR